MSLADKKLTPGAISTYGVTAAPDRLTGTAAQNKALFDRLVRDAFAGLYNGLIDELGAETGAGEIGTAEIEGVTGANIQTVLESLKIIADSKEGSAEAAAALLLKADKTETAQHIKTVSFNAQTGVFTFTKENGQTVTIDTLLEKLAVNFAYDASTQELVLTLADGTTQRVSLSAFITETEFQDSDQLDFSVSNHIVTATIKAGSITDTMLSSGLVTILQGYVTAAAGSATNAASSASAASGSASAAATSATSAGNSASSAAASAAAAQSAAETAAADAAALAAEETAELVREEMQGYVSAASSSESAAASSKNAAAASEQAAAQSENAAASSQTAAAGSASDAASSASAAATSAGSAATSETNAGNSASAAAASAAAAESAAQTAAQEAAEAAAQEAAAAVRQEVEEDAQKAADSAEDSEAWAVGQRGGVDVPISDETYHNNAKYWSDQAAAAAGGGVSSFNGRGGIVIPQSGDYTAEMVGADAIGAAGAVQSNLVAHILDSYIHVTSEEKATWNGKQDAIPANTYDAYGSASAVQSNLDAKIPSGASSSNQLVTASQMGDAISSVEAKQLYKTSSQGSFATKAELLAATVFYGADGTTATPTRNDVAYVLSDIDHNGKSAKYVIANDPSSTVAPVWGFVITFSDNTFSQAQMDAINSGITAGDVALIGTAVQSSEKGAANGVSSLDSNGKVPPEQMPYQYSETDLTAGTSQLATGTLYFVYE